MTEEAGTNTQGFLRPFLPASPSIFDIADLAPSKIKMDKPGPIDKNAKVVEAGQLAAARLTDFCVFVGGASTSADQHKTSRDHNKPRPTQAETNTGPS